MSTTMAPTSTPQCSFPDTAKKYFLFFKGSEKVIDVRGGSSTGSWTREISHPSLIRWDLNHGLNQKFVFEQVEGNIYYIKNASTSLVLDVHSASKEIQAPVVMYSLHHSANQQFQLVPNEDGSFKIKNIHSGLFLNVSHVGGIIQSPVGIDLELRAV